MKKRFTYSINELLLLLLLLGSSATNAQPVFNGAANKSVAGDASKYHSNAVGFYENKGQVTDQNNKPNAAVKYLLSSPGFNVQLRQTGFSYDTYTETADETAEAIPQTLPTGRQAPNSQFQTPKNFTRRYHRVDIDLQGCNPNAVITAEGKSSAYYNYLTAGTPDGGISNVHYYEKVIYKNIYPNIDLEFFTNSKSNRSINTHDDKSGRSAKAHDDNAKGGTGVEYNFIVHPGGNPADIKLAYKGANKVTLTDDKLVVNVAAGDFSENIPSSYIKGNPSANIKVSYADLGNNVFTFSLPPHINALESDLVIDPTPNLNWGTYYGGAGTDLGYGIALDASDNVYITGNTTSTSGIATAGAYQTVLGGGNDVLIAKFNPTGTSLLWATYYGGAGNETGQEIALDGGGNVYICGQTGSNSGIATLGAYQTTLVGSNGCAFVAKFDPTGTSLLWGTYYGGGNEVNYCIALDASDNVYISGLTYSTSGIATAGAYQATYGGGGSDVYVAKFNATGTSLLWGTYYGGTGTDQCYGMALDASGNVYISGNTTSASGIATTGAYQATYGGGTYDVFVAEFNATGTSLLWGTYYGGTGTDISEGVVLDASNNVYINGYTSSISGIATPGAYQTTYGGGTYDAFVAKFSATGSSLLWGTYYGGSGGDLGAPNGIALDAGNNVYITGVTNSASGIATPGVYQTSLTGTQNVFVSKFNSSGSSLLWGTYYGGTGSEQSAGIILDASNNIYIDGYTSSTSGIATTGAYQATYGGGGQDAFLAMFSPLISTPITGALNVCAGGSTITLSDATAGGTWTSGSAAIATVGSSNGVVTGVAAGTAVITYNISAGFATANVTVNALPNAGTISGPSALCIGSTVTLSDGAAGWFVQAAMPTAMESSAIAAINNNIYVMGGQNSGGCSSIVQVYNATSNTWGTVASMPACRYRGDGAGVINGLIYVPGGWTISPPLPNNNLFIYDPVANVWSSGPAMPGLSADGVTGVINNILYVTTGANGFAGYPNYLYSYNPGTSSWATLTSSPVAHANGMGGVINGLLYVVGGFNTSGTATGELDVYDPVANSWSTVASMPMAEIGAASSVMNGLLYVVGGQDGAGNILDTMFIYDPVANVWSTGPSALSYRRVLVGGGAVANNSFYFIGGDNGSVALTNNESYTPYAWSSGTASVATVTQAGVVTGVGGGTATISYTDGGGCIATATANVTVSPVPTLANASSNSPVCAGGTLNLFANTPNNVTGYSWSGPNGFTATLQNPPGISNVTIAANGIYTVTVNNGSGSGCTATYTTTATVTAPTIFAFTGGGSYCSGGAGISIGLGGSQSGVNYQLYNGASTVGAPVAGTGSAISFGLQTAAGSYAAVATNTVTNCTSNMSGSANIVINPLPFVFSVTGGGSYPAGGSGVVIGLFGSQTGVSYQLYNGLTPVSGPVAGNGSAISFGPQTAVGTYSVVATNTTTTCSDVMGGTTVSICTAPAITGSNIVCIGSTIALTDAATGGGTWTSSTSSVATIDLNSGVLSGINSGASVITFTSAATGCTNTITVTAAPPPSSITGFFSVCLGSTTTLSDQVTGGVWASSNSNVATVSPFTSDGVVLGISPGSSVITYAVSTCIATTTITVNALPLAISGPSAVCAGSAITLSDATSGGVWVSSNISAATVGSANGIVTGVPPGPGIATITYSVITGCSATTTITVNPLPLAITGITTICATYTSVLSDITGGGTWSSNNPSVATVDMVTGVVTGVSPGGSATITYTVPTGCYVTTLFTVHPEPSAIIGTTTICAGTTTALTDALGGGTWSSSLTVIATVGSVSGVVTGGANPGGTTVLTYTLPTGCFTTASVVVNPVPAAITGNTIVCAGLTTNLSDATGGGTWTSVTATVATIGAGTGIVTGVTGTPGGTSVISYTLPTSCFTTTIVTVNPTPAPITGPTVVCVGATIFLTDATTGGTWSSNNLNTTAGVNSGSVTGNAPVGSVITYMLPTGCINTLFITVNPAPAAIAGNTTVCAGQSTTLSDGTVGGTWTSSNTNVAIVGSLSGIVTGDIVSVTGTTVVTYSLTTGCAMTTTVTVNPLPAAITGATPICSGLTATLSDITPNGTWSSGLTGIATVTSGSGPGGGIVTGVGAGGTTPITYTLVATGCIATTSVTVNPLPGAITGNTTVCAGLTTQLSDVTSGGTWASSNSAVATIGPSSGLVTANAQGSTNITYTLGTGCIMITTVTVNPLPGPITGTDTICAGLTATLSDAATGGIWSSATVSVATIGSGTGIVTGSSVSVTGRTKITYTLPTGCAMTTTVTVNPLPAAITGPNSVCSGLTINLNDATIGGAWSSSNTNVAVIISAAGTGILTGGTAGLDTISYTLGTGCIMTKTVSVNIQPAAIINGPVSICNGATESLSDVTPGGVWTSANTSIATVDPTGTVTGDGVGTTHITYGINGCTVTTLVLINAQPGAVTGNMMLCNGATTLLNDTPTGGTWSSSNTLVATINSTSGNAVSTGVGTAVITYTLGNCVSTASLTVNVQPGIITGTTGNLCNLSTITLSDATPGGIWSSANANAVIGSVSGIVTGQNVGTDIILYTVGNCVTAKALSINTQPAAITGISYMCLGDSTQLSDATPGVAWSSTNVSIAGVSNTGLVTGLTAGSDTIIAAIGSCSAMATVTVNPSPSPMTGLFYVCVGTTTALSDLSPLGSWSSGNITIAAAGAFTGIVTGVGTGTTTITYTLPTGCITTHTLTVLLTPYPISGDSTVCAGNPAQLSDIINGGTWTSGNTVIANIGTGSGLAMGVSSGTAIITYSLGTGCNVVTPLVVNPLSLISGSGVVCVGQAINLSDTTVGGTWSSSNMTTATVNPVTGVVTGVAAGTVYINYNLPTGCTASASVTVLPLPAPITGMDSVCAGGSVTTLSDAGSGGVWSSGNTTIATVDPFSGDVTGVLAGAATIIYTQGGCPQTVTVTVNPLPLAITGNNNVCLGLAQALSDSTTGGTWSSSSTTIATVGSSSGIVIGNIAGSATIFYTIGTGCSASLLVTVNPLPLPITGHDSVCVGSTTGLSDATPGGEWFSSNYSVATVGFSSGVVGGVSPGSGFFDSVVITYQVVTGCSITATVTVSPAPLAITGANSVCTGSTISLTDGTVGGTWSSSNSAAATIDPSTGIVTGVTTGNSLISYTTGGGCTATEVLTVNPTPAPITGNTSVCYNLTTNLSDATPGGTWSSGSPSIGTVDSFTGVVYDIGPGSFPVIYRLPTGCFSDTIITVNPPPLAINGLSSVCQGATITLSDAIGFGTTGVWTSSNGSVATITPLSGILTGVSAGSTIVTYTMGGGTCYQVQLVTVNPLPDPITGTTSVCVGLTTSLLDATGGGTWSSITTSVATIDQTFGVVTGVTSGTSIVSYTLPTSCAATVTVTVDSLPVITGNTNVCLGGTQTLTGSPSLGTWSSSNGVVATVGLSTGVVYGNNIGVDSITYTISTTGCIQTTTVAVHPLPAIYTVTGGGSYCSGNSGVPIGLSGSQIGVEYLLYLGSTPTGTYAGTGSALNFGLQTTAGTYTVVAINTFTTCSNSMTGSATVTIHVSPVPLVSIGVVPGDTVCAGTVVTYTATSVNGGATPAYQWRVNGTSVGAGSASYSYTPSNGDAVSVSMTSILMCASPATVSDTVRMTVLAYETPSLGLLVSPADTVCVGSAVTLTAVPSYGGSAPVYLWTVDGTTVIGAAGPVYTYLPTNGDIVYCRMVSDYQCRLADTVSSGHEVITVDTPVIPGVSIIANPGWVISRGASDTLHAVVTNGGTSPTYQWFINGVPVAGATTSEFVDNNLSYPNEDSVGCLVSGSSGYCPESGFGWLYIVVNAAGVQQVSSMTADLSVVPNPNSGVFTLKGTLGTANDEEVSLEVTDMLGQVVYKDAVLAKGGRIEEQVRLGGTLANGMYMLSVHSASVSRVFHIVVEQ